MYHNAVPASTPFLHVSAWVPWPFPLSDEQWWGLYRVETRYDTQGRIAAVIRHTYPTLMRRSLACQVAAIFNQ